MKILITGAAGFFGSNLCEYLLSRGFEVVGIDNFSTFYSPAIKDYNIQSIAKNENFKLFKTDILDLTSLECIYKKEGPFQTVIHLAAWAGVTNSIHDPLTYVRNNVEGTVNIANLTVKYDIKSLIFSSSSSVYGTNTVPFNEDMPILYPLAPYPVTKRSCELLLHTYSVNHGLNVGIIRIFNPQGKRMRPDLALTKLIQSCEYGTEFPVFWPKEDWGKTGRDYCYIGHMFEAIERLVEKPFQFEIFNLGNSLPITMKELFETVEDVTGRSLNLNIKPKRQGEMLLTYADINKAQSMLGYNPVTSIRESIEIYYSWYKFQDERYKRGKL